MKAFFLLIILISSFNLFAQSRYTIGLSTSSMATTIDYKYGYETFRNWGWKSTTGAGISVLKFKSNLVFYKFGLNYRRKDLTRKGFPEVRVTIDSTGKRTWHELGHKDEEKHFNYLSLPMIVHYKVFKGKGANLVLLAGAEPEWLYRTYNYTNSTYSGKQTIITYPYRGHLTLMVQGGLGWFQPIAKKWLLLVEPQYTYRFSKTDRFNFDNHEANYDRHNLGLNIELHYKLWQP